jgi:acyl carrier protein
METEFHLVRRITAEVLGAREDSIRERTRFIEDLGADSFELFEIMTRIEETCRVSFDAEALKKVITVRDAAALLAEAEHA